METFSKIVIRYLTCYLKWNETQKRIKPQYQPARLKTYKHTNNYQRSSSDNGNVAIPMPCVPMCMDWKWWTDITHQCENIDVPFLFMQQLQSLNVDPNCCCTYQRFIIVIKKNERNLDGNQHLHNLNATHDLTKASTTHINHKDNTTKKHRPFLLQPKQESGLVLNSTTPSKTIDIVLPLPYVHGW